MRDPARIDDIVELVWTLWQKHPDWRLGQLIAIAARTKDVFSIEDTVLARRLKRMIEQDTTGPHDEQRPEHPEPDAD